VAGHSSDGFSTHDVTDDEQLYLAVAADGLLVLHPPIDDPLGRAVALAFMLNKLDNPSHDERYSGDSPRRGRVWQLAVELYDDGGEAWCRAACC